MLTCNRSMAQPTDQISIVRFLFVVLIYISQSLTPNALLQNNQWGLLTRGKQPSSFYNRFLFAESNGNNAIDEDTVEASTKMKKVVIVGGGWAGFSAADALDDVDNVEVCLLDASPRGPGGLAGGWKSSKVGMPVEAGIHGFWREYRNTIDVMERRIGLDVDQVLTKYTPSVLISSNGRVALAPVLGNDKGSTDGGLKNLDLSKLNPDSLPEIVAELLPPPLDVALLSDFEDSSPLTAADRITALGLLGAWADFGQEDAASWDRYDKISADNLFRTVAAVSPTLYDELVSPLLHVLPMTPGYDCSAAAALSCFHVFAMQARGAFDVRWCRGTITSKIFDPWADKLKSRGNVEIRGSSRVTSIARKDTNRLTVTVNDQETIDCDACILAVGATTAKQLVTTSPALQGLDQTSKWKGLRGVTCVAVRLFLDPEICGQILSKAMADTPVFVCGPKVGGIPELVETGFCVYDLQRLQDDFSTKYKENECFTIEVDFFRAERIANMEDDTDVARLALKAVSVALDLDAPVDLDSSLLDVSVVRARNAVSHFCVGSASSSPSVKLGQGIYMCGDWVDRKGHASWSTEKSVVTGKQSALALSKDLGLACSARVIPSAEDSPQLALLRKIAATTRTFVPNDVIPPAPWVVLRQLLQASRLGG